MDKSKSVKGLREMGYGGYCTRLDAIADANTNAPHAITDTPARPRGFSPYCHEMRRWPWNVEEFG
eukprot:1158048-Pelagomonas_calceolata.AAC.11